MIGHVDDRILVRSRFVGDMKCVFFQTVSDGHGERSRETLVHIRAVQSQGDGGVRVLFHGPDPFGILMKTAVQAVFPVIFIKGISGAVQRKRSAANAVGAAAHVAAEACGVVLVAGDIVKAEDHVPAAAIFVRRKETD